MKIVLTIAAILMCGCSTYRPYTGAEKTLMGAAITAQAFDVATTSYALSQPGFSEGNAVWWGDDDGAILAGMLATKAAMCGVAYLAGQAWPETRSWSWGFLGAFGFGMGAWNVWQVSQ